MSSDDWHLRTTENPCLAAVHRVQNTASLIVQALARISKPAGTWYLVRLLAGTCFES